MTSGSVLDRVKDLPVHVKVFFLALQDKLLGLLHGLNRDHDDVRTEFFGSGFYVVVDCPVEEQGKDQQGNQQGDRSGQDNIAENFAGNGFPGNMQNGI